ncbi:LOW QUALITY PROTEIN: uncharacterized protein LOC110821594 [Carica papaya]|uniref:LOW QUALITY PROTEIN: uncharacterized protein LOC110821594 n=1 Tax=Carica papaya TaxID=3649 RepID=UPI000B8C8C57|nr:LOW QUALITY PROTEIN: uncharacterized protein LOC110821594 [Carica papaya]
MAGVKRRIHTDSDICALQKELDEVSCPICMDHPHNAVLLLCSSHDKGCRSYICDTSYRHSNCLDRFRKLKADSRNSSSLPHFLPINPLSSSSNSDMNSDLRTGSVEGNGNYSQNQINNVALSSERSREHSIHRQHRNLESQGEGILERRDSEFRERIEAENLHGGNSSETRLSLKCPLCRGSVLGWQVVEEARKYLNLKKRSCSRESCSFYGNYQELRRHARRVHPTTRPSDIDPSREQAWRRLENRREYGDIVSAIQSAMPGAIVVGDYVIENEDRFSAERGSGAGNVNALTTFFLFQMIGSFDHASESRARSRAWTRHRRPAALPDRRLLWGENLLGLQDNEVNDDLHILSDESEEVAPVPRRRRRLMRSRSDEDRS